MVRKVDGAHNHFPKEAMNTAKHVGFAAHVKIPRWGGESLEGRVKVLSPKHDKISRLAEKAIG